METKRKPNVFLDALYENRYICISFLSSVFIMLLVFLCFDMRPFGDITILRMDLYHQYGPLFAELRERLLNGESLIYSWNSGGGGTFIGNFFNYLSSPLSFLVLLFDHEHVPDAIALMILLKAAFSSSAFAFYLKKTFNKNDFSIVAFSVVYAFGGYFLAYYWNVMWLDAVVFLPFVLLGIESIIKQGKFGMYTIALAATMISNFYMGYMMCIFSVLYFVIFYFGNFTPSAKLGNIDIADETATKNKILKFFDYRIINSGLRFAFASLLAGAVAAIALLPVFFALQSSSATSGTFPSDYKSYFNFFDFLVNHLAGIDPTIRSSGEDVLPNVYCGVLTLVLTPLYLFAKSIPKREKIFNVILLIVLALSFNINYLNYIWHGFHFPNDLPYRFSFMYSFVLLTLAYKAFIRIKEFSWKEILLSGIGLAFFIVLAQKVTSKNLSELTVIVSLIFVAIYIGVLFLFRNRKMQTVAVSALLLCCTISELAIANTDSYDIDQPLKNYSSDYEAFDILKENLDEFDGSDTYRMELSNLRTRMDPCWYNYNGLSSFSSMAYEKLSNLQKNLGMYGNYINSYTYNPQTPIYNSMFSLKYLVKNEQFTRIGSNFYTQLMSNDKYTAYQNDYYLPMAYCVNEDIVNWKYDYPNPFEVQSEYFEKSTGISNVLTSVNATSVLHDNVNYITKEEVNSGYYSFSKVQNDIAGNSTITYPVTSAKNLYVYVKSSQVTSITVEIGDYSRTQNVKTPYILDLGLCNAGEEITVKISYEENSGSAYCYVYALDTAKFESGYNSLSSGSMNIAKQTDTKIEGSVTAAKSCVLYTSIPYDKGWSVTVDGEKVAEENIVVIGGALLGVKLNAGTHDIKFHYTARGLTPGIIISVISVAVLVLLLWLMKKEKLRFLKYATATVSSDITDDELQSNTESSDNPSKEE